MRLFFTIVSGLLFFGASAQGKIVVQVSNFRNNNGNCTVCLYNNAGAFSGKGVPLRTLKVAVADRAATVVFDNVPDGTYAVSVIHDANGNNRFDTNFLGIPTEGYGASQNNLPFAAAPKFEDNKFLVAATGTILLNIRLRYLL